MIVTLLSCNVEEKPIIYGTDDCAHCKMKIVDQRYGSEIVTSKGKVYMFDAIECMVEYIHEKNIEMPNLKFVLITPYNTPGNLSDATKATYLRSAKMPSPMAAYLTAFSEKEIANEFHTKNGGVLYSWNELFNDYEKIRSTELIKDE